MPTGPGIAPFLWFDSNAEEAVNFYLSVFPNSRRIREVRNTDDTPGPTGSLLTIEFELNGLRFVALNGGPVYHFNEAVSFFIECKTQAEIDYYWTKLTDGGTEIQCGWLKDRFGLCWQVVPENILELLRHPKAMKAMLGMVKMDLATLKQAARS